MELKQIYCSYSCTRKFTMVFYNSGIIVEVNIVAEQKQAHLVTTFLFFTSLHSPQLFHCPHALPLFRRP